jgi:N-terminal acetyltransferase 2
MSLNSTLLVRLTIPRRTLSFRQTPSLTSSYTRSSFLRNYTSSSLISSRSPTAPPFKLRLFRFNSTSTTSQSATKSEVEESLFARLRRTMKTHGSTALGVYLFLSTIDFTLTFFLILALGADKVREFEDWVLTEFDWVRNVKNKVKKNEGEGSHVEESGGESVSTSSNSSNHVSNSTLYTTAILAYAIHKTLLLPFRAGVTAAVTPKVVRMLRSRGWNVGGNGNVVSPVKTRTVGQSSK